ncbi:MAG: ATP-binding cassette domain-containing protein [Lachnospiraceae bacterium]|nr:ATP-binding cassette domain-containing protein [Lachnospiraceae bacterium]
MEVIKIENLSFSYPESERKAIDNISMSVNEGEFVLICGKSGCGKTTLARQLKPVLRPKGDVLGQVYYRGRALDELSDYEKAAAIGYVMQDADTQIVTDKVWHELAFGLENLGFDNKTIRRRVAEISNYFGINEWFDRKTFELSGGQKQILNLASVMVMNPDVLILDEPVSQLCEVAANDFLHLVKRINEELLTTIIMIEHRLENIYHMADRVAVLEEGRLAAYGGNRDVAGLIMENEYYEALPSAAKIYRGLGMGGDSIPLNVKEGRRYIGNIIKCASGTIADNMNAGEEKRVKSKKKLQGIRACVDTSNKSAALELSEVYFRYEKNGRDIIYNLTMVIKKGSFNVILGGNGSGKTTLLSVIAGIHKPYRGRVKLFKNTVSMLAQNPETMFIKDTVYEDLKMAVPRGSFDDTAGHGDAQCNSVGFDAKIYDEQIRDTARMLDIEGCLTMHPYDLSGGEKQRAALAKALLTKPDILVLDEPTKGFDFFHKKELGLLLKKLSDGGMTVIMVSHDIEFAAEYADACMMYFGGAIVCSGTPYEVFSGNRFYTTAADRIAGDYFDGVLTQEDVVRECRKIII